MEKMANFDTEMEIFGLNMGDFSIKHKKIEKMAVFNEKRGNFVKNRQNIGQNGQYWLIFDQNWQNFPKMVKKGQKMAKKWTFSKK